MAIVLKDQRIVDLVLDLSRRSGKSAEQIVLEALEAYAQTLGIRVAKTRRARA